MFRPDSNEIVRDDGSRTDKMVKNLSKSKNLTNKKSKNLMRIGAISELIFLMPSIKKAFNHL